MLIQRRLLITGRQETFGEINAAIKLLREKLEALQKPRATVRGYKTPDALVIKLDELLTETQHGGQDAYEDDHTFCDVCGDNDGHTALCPIPAIQKWMATEDGP